MLMTLYPICGLNKGKMGSLSGNKPSPILVLRPSFMELNLRGEHLNLLLQPIGELEKKPSPFTELTAGLGQGWRLSQAMVGFPMLCCPYIGNLGFE